MHSKIVVVHIRMPVYVVKNFELIRSKLHVKHLQ
nr:MAG TPA: hypothetical protein [Caudoviricetes sp.]